MKKAGFFYCILFFAMQKPAAQSCMVSADSLKGQYSGGCDKGKAEGKGVATGTDSYNGSFKNGYPDGEGKYTWKNGNWYEGSWKKGFFEGHGTYSRKDSSQTGNALVLAGFWKKGKYTGTHIEPYMVHTLTNNISDVSVRKFNKKEPEIIISVKSITAGALSLMNPVLPKPQLTDIQFVEGRFEQQVADETSSPVINKYIFRKVTFPFYAILTFETIGSKLHPERLGIELHEDGYWFVQVTIDN